jgi:hypothetical protein
MTTTLAIKQLKESQTAKLVERTICMYVIMQTATKKKEERWYDQSWRRKILDERNKNAIHSC